MRHAAARILAVEDDPTIVEALSVSLADGGYAVTTAAAGEALGLAAAERPAAVLIYVTLPGGVEVARRLRADARTRAIPMMIVSAHAGLGALATELGVEAIVTPVAPDAVLRRVRRLAGEPDAP